MLAFQTDMSTQDLFRRYSQTISMALYNVTSLQGSEDGHTLLNWQAGQQPNLFGPDHVHVNHLVSRDNMKEWPTLDTYGLPGSGSSASASLTQSLGNRLRRKMGAYGLIMCASIWKDEITPLGR